LTSICGAGCSVLNLTANTGNNIIHTIEVRDFDYSPKDITVGAGEKIHFVWTGAIPHTVTSDAVSGPEVWNSGLLGQNATSISRSTRRYSSLFLYSSRWTWWYRDVRNHYSITALHG
jgi:plastocyanin